MSSLFGSVTEDLTSFVKSSLNGTLPLYNGKTGKSGLPTAIYKVVKHPKEEKYGLEPVQARWELPGKLYGELKNNAVRVWNRYANLYSRGGGSVGVIATGDSGAGKALHLDTPIRVINGWKLMRDINVGDRVIGDDGFPTTVTNVFYHQSAELYKITFEDGRSTRPCKDHLWEVMFDKGSRTTVNTKELLWLFNHEDDKISIPLCKPVFNTTFSTPINADEFGRKIVSGIVERIPKCYLENSKDVRELLFNTIFKDRGNVLNIKDGFYLTSFSSSNKFLMDDVVYLARSLGYVSKLFETDKEYLAGFKESDRLYIKSIELIDPYDAACITVDNESHLYICEDFIVTHNTETCKTLCNIALDNNMPVIEVSGIKCTLELIDFLAGLNNVAIFMDEFAKNFGNLQEQMLTALSDVYGTNKLFIITENDTYLINKFILNSPSRVRYHFRFKKIDKPVVDEFCEDMGVSDKFLLELNEKYDKSPIFSFNHLKALVEEHLDYPEDSLEGLIKVLNVSVLDITNVYRVTKIYDPVSKEEIAFNPNSISVESFNRGGYVYVRLQKSTPEGTNSLRFSKNDIITTYDDGEKVLLNCSGLIITMEITKDMGGDSRW